MRTTMDSTSTGTEPGSLPKRRATTLAILNRLDRRQTERCSTTHCWWTATANSARASVQTETSISRTAGSPSAPGESQPLDPLIISLIRSARARNSIPARLDSLGGVAMFSFWIASGSVFAAKVANTASSRDMTFLTALVPISEAAWDNRPSITALDPVQPEAGLWLSDGPRIAAALFNDLPTGSRNISGLQLDGLTGVVEYLNGIPSRV